jgi:hypothetical protein
VQEVIYNTPVPGGDYHAVPEKSKGKAK